VYLGLLYAIAKQQEKEMVVPPFPARCPPTPRVMPSFPTPQHAPAAARQACFNQGQVFAPSVPVDT